MPRLKGGDPVLAQRVADLLELGEVALPLRSRRGRVQILNSGRHGGQHPGVHRVGLGASAERPGEGPDLEGVDRIEGESGLQEGVLEVAVEGSGGFVRDPVDSGADPCDQLSEAVPLVRKPGCSPLGRCVNVEPLLGDVDPDGAEDDAHLLFPSPVLVMRASMLVYPFRTEGRTVATKTPMRPLTAMRPRGPTTVSVGHPLRLATPTSAGIQQSGPSPDPVLQSK